mmetsp:Transcript_44948/g.114934  ORF Transcript_44948/g.114934 Transcript_44948/m.114934 type:complete len:224 (-) Transcript_44948:151-822(-)
MHMHGVAAQDVTPALCSCSRQPGCCVDEVSHHGIFAAHHRISNQTTEAHASGDARRGAHARCCKEAQHLGCSLDARQRLLVAAVPRKPKHKNHRQPFIVHVDLTCSAPHLGLNHVDAFAQRGLETAEPRHVFVLALMVLEIGNDEENGDQAMLHQGVGVVVTEALCSDTFRRIPEEQLQPHVVVATARGDCLQEQIRVVVPCCPPGGTGLAQPPPRQGLVGGD